MEATLAATDMGGSICDLQSALMERGMMGPTVTRSLERRSGKCLISSRGVCACVRGVQEINAISRIN